MAKNPSANKKTVLTIPKASASDLIGRQSVRASFRLTPKCIDAIAILGQHLQLMPKSLFDHLVQERETLEAIATKTKASNPSDEPRTAKTFVISRDAGEVLGQIARRWKISRDLLVEASIRHLMPLIEREQVRHSLRKGLIKKMREHLDRGNVLFEEIKAALGDSDPMCGGMKNVLASYAREFSTISACIEKGEAIEHFEIEG